MIEISLFKKEDFFGIEDPVEATSNMVDDEGFFNLTDSGVSVTVREDGEVMGCGGVVLYDNNHGGMWIRISKEAAKRSLLLLECIADAFNIIKESLGDIEILAHVKVGFKKGEKFAKFFGFEPNGQTERDGTLNTYIWRGK